MIKSLVNGTNIDINNINDNDNYNSNNNDTHYLVKPIAGAPVREGGGGEDGAAASLGRRIRRR